MKQQWPWFALALLGAYHGLNPGMGWLFALSLGLQEKSRKAVLRALLPVGLGHAVAISLAILVVQLFQVVFSPRILQFLVGLILFAFGLCRIFRAHHPTGGGMRVGFKDLLFWSFLMASAQGAGMMLAPILLAQPMLGMKHGVDAGAAGMRTLGTCVLALAVSVHTLSLVLVTGFLALFFYQSYQETGLRVLQRAWFNFDLLWAVALFVAAALALLI